MVEIDRADSSHLPAVRALLVGAGLPVDGLMEVPTSVFVARDGARVVGAVALEHHGDDGLLRSLVVDFSRRQQGVGSQLAEAAEAEATRQGMAGVYLLTETAADFFTRREYRPIARDGAPGPVMASIEWAEACGESAVAMVKAVQPIRT